MSNKTQLQANNTQLASLIQTLQGKAAGGGSSGGDGGATLTTGDLSVTSSMYEPGLDKVTLTSDSLAASSRQVIVILHNTSTGYHSVTCVLHRSTLSSDWVHALGNSNSSFSIGSVVVNENSITAIGANYPGTYSFIAM